MSIVQSTARFGLLGVFLALAGCAYPPPGSCVQNPPPADPGVTPGVIPPGGTPSTPPVPSHTAPVAAPCAQSGLIGFGGYTPYDGSGGGFGYPGYGFPGYGFPGYGYSGYGYSGYGYPGYGVPYGYGAGGFGVAIGGDDFRPGYDDGDFYRDHEQDFDHGGGDGEHFPHPEFHGGPGGPFHGGDHDGDGDHDGPMAAGPMRGGAMHGGGFHGGGHAAGHGGSH